MCDGRPHLWSVVSYDIVATFGHVSIDEVVMMLTTYGLLGRDEDFLMGTRERRQDAGSSTESAQEIRVVRVFSPVWNLPQDL